MSRKRVQKAHARSSANVYELERALVENGKAYKDGPNKRKTWSRHDLETISPLTFPQEEMFRAFMEGQHLVAYGSAGTGKTFVAIYLALNELLNKQSEIEKILIIRSVVSTREIGHLPGTIEEKTAVYELPYKDMFATLIGRPSTYENMKEAGLVEFGTTSFIRGVTWDNTIIIVDEGQNMNFHEINSLMTRLGKNSRVIFAGDIVQTDLRRKYDVSGMGKMISVTERMNGFTNIHFTRDDIVRSAFVKSWITAVEDYDEQHGE